MMQVRRVKRKVQESELKGKTGKVGRELKRERREGSKGGMRTKSWI
jgi:hypothetical protein